MPLKTSLGRSFLAPTGALLGLLAIVGAMGCEPRIKPEEFGTPVYEESKLPGAGEPPISLDRAPPADS